MTHSLATVGAHALVFQPMGGGVDTIRTPALALSPSESTVLVSVGRGQAAAFAPPTDDVHDAAYGQLGMTRRYTNWSDSGTALYALENARGQAPRTIQVATPPDDEVTMAVVEVLGGPVEDVAWTEDLHPDNFWRLRRWLFSSNTVSSAFVETSGPATLVAFWWGDAAEEGEKTAEPGNGFVRIDSVLEEGPLVQCAVAVRHVDAAGRYNVTWTNSPLQGAQLWLVAVADRKD